MRKFLLLSLILLSLPAATARADRLELVRYTNLWTGSPARIADAAGATYVAERGHLLITDSEISEYGDAVDPATGKPVFEGVNVFEISLDAAELHGSWLATPPDPSRSEPVGITWSPADAHVYITDDDQKRIYRYPFGDALAFGTPVASAQTSFDGRYTDPEGIALDPTSGDLLVSSGTKEERVLRFRYSAAADTFEFVSEFKVGPHLPDPEGIAVHPVTGHVFLIARAGIAEFSASGDFVQVFDYGFLHRTGVSFILPGGGTFAPSSDPNDARDALSLYVTCRGIDNGSFPARNSLDGGLAELRLVRTPMASSPLRVPSVYATIQEAVEAASDGDTIHVSPGTYTGQVDLGGKRLALVSDHFFSGDYEAVATTVLDGDGADYVLRVGDPKRPTAGGSLIYGFFIRNGNDGITATDPFDIAYCLIKETTDGIDYEGGGGTVRYCNFRRNRDDAIDLDGPTAVVIEHCQLADNQDDGVEIRLHPHPGPDTLDVVIRDNLIVRNGEDGIQLIGYDVPTARRFRFEGNRIISTAMAGIGLMSSATTREDYRAAPLPEQMVIVHNTFFDNAYHITGGDHALVAGNILAGARRAALKGLTGASRVARNLMWANGHQVEDMPDLKDAIESPPRFADASLRLRPESAALDAGQQSITWLGRTRELMPPAEIRGTGPDLGALER